MSTPQISVIVPTYNVERFLLDFLDSLEAQSAPLAQLELIFVNDGSTDASAELLRRWIPIHAPGAILLEQENGGLSSARNAGLRAASGEWVTFPDPDDVLPVDYFEIASAYLDSKAAAKVQLVVARLLLLADESGELQDDHPLRFRFEKGRHAVDLTRHPEYIHLQAASAFYRRSEIEFGAITFDARVRPHFEDAKFTANYLLLTDAPKIAFLSDLEYHYRQRADGSSLVQTSWSRPEKFRDLPYFGYLDLLKTTQHRYGSVPLWLQNVVLYDLLYFLKEGEKASYKTHLVAPEMLDDFLEIIEEVISLVDTDAIYGFKVVRHPWERLLALGLGIKGVPPPSSDVCISQWDPDTELVQLAYYFSGDAPVEECRSRGVIVSPAHAKTRSVNYWGRSLMFHRLLWLSSSGSVQVSLDGRRMPLHLGPPTAPRYVVGPTPIRKEFAGPESDPQQGPLETDTSDPQGVDSPLSRGRRVAGIRRFARTRLRSHRQEVATPPEQDGVERSPGSQPRGASWLFIANDGHGDSNVRALFQHLNESNVAISRRLISGNPRGAPPAYPEESLVPHSERLDRLVADCQCLVLEDATLLRSLKLDLHRFRSRDQVLVLIQDPLNEPDLAEITRGVPIRLLLCATRPGYEQLVQDYSPYNLTTREVRLTGFPRHDHFHQEDAHADSHDRLLLLPAPSPAGSAGGTVRSPLLSRRKWMNSLRHVAQRYRLKVTAIASDSAEAELWKPHVDEVISNREAPGAIARTTLAVSEWPASAFDIAYLKRPVVFIDDQAAPLGSGDLSAFVGVTCKSPEQLASAVERAMSGGHAGLSEASTPPEQIFPTSGPGASARAAEAISDILPMETTPPE